MDEFRRQLFLYEAPEDGGGEPPEPIDEPADEPVEEPEGGATEQEAQAWALSQGDWEQTVQYLQQTAPILQQVAAALPYLQQQQQQAQPQQQEQQLPEIDPFDPASVTGYIQQSIQQGIQQAMAEQLGPYEGMLGMVASEQGETLARAELEKITNDIGKFDQDMAFLIAAGQIEGGNDPSQSLRNAAVYSRDWEQKIRQDERSRLKGEFENLQGAPGEVPIGSSAGSEVQPVPTGPRRYHEVVERVLARQNPTNVVG